MPCLCMPCVLCCHVTGQKLTANYKLPLVNFYYIGACTGTLQRVTCYMHIVLAIANNTKINTNKINVLTNGMA